MEKIKTSALVILAIVCSLCVASCKREKPEGQDFGIIEIKYIDVSATTAGEAIVDGRSVGFGKDGILKSLKAIESLGQDVVIRMNVKLSKDLGNRIDASSSGPYEPLRGTIFESDPTVKKHLDVLTEKYKMFITVERKW